MSKIDVLETSKRECAITLAICTFNRQDHLRKTLKGIEAIRCVSPWEVLVVDNGSSDGTWEIAEQFARGTDLQMRIFREPRRGVSFARNLALEMGHGEILLFVDDDVDVDPMLLESHLSAFQDGSVLATGGRVIPRFPPGTPKWIQDALLHEVGGPTAHYDYGDQILEITTEAGFSLPYTVNCAVRRQVAVDVGGFRTDLGWTREGKRIGGEDIELFTRISRHKGKILYLPDARVVHRIESDRTTIRYYKSWNVAYGRASIRLKGRPGVFMAFAKLLEQSIRVIRYTFLPGNLDLDSKLQRLRKRYRAIGKILEILQI